MAQKPREVRGPLAGLSAQLVATILIVVVMVQIVFFLPSAANFRVSLLDDKLRIAVVAARVLDTVPDVMSLPQEMTDRLLIAAGATAIVYRREGQSQLVALEGADMPREAVTIDLRTRDALGLMLGVFDTLFSGGNRTLRIIAFADGDQDSLVEVIVPEAPMRADLIGYSTNILIISLLISGLAAAALLLFLTRLVISPLRRLTANVDAYRQAPENASLIISPSDRSDEIGVLERDLSAMQTDLFGMLRQRRHLADLGLAVAKINHDLRNTLTSAQLLSDQVATLDDPKVQRLAPRLVQTLDRAIGFAQSVLDYGRQSVTPPKPQPVDMKLLIDEAAIEAGLLGNPVVRFVNQVPDDIALKVDPDQIARVFTNLLKNAREALEAAAERIDSPQVTVTARVADTISITVADNGPGLPPRARDNLFVAFEGSARAGGTGLGLAIARELTEAHGGTLTHADGDPGTRFTTSFPTTMRV